ncbi:BPL-N domain-containing protein [Pseudonocardia xinjiangensis]|uniref:Biotin-protein ligase N-terminal domain-containing protein n=1 Tax=Pseudonocardia xinjiangensis TaxID=75289 RepID=A0ABX1RE94_9PSEU|nr:BPL-N domain-containing protein [Pseudonocardia xinjiangensis]NMH77471.1 hypothetical protein [Pseudonocardia xinjiangensis]
MSALALVYRGPAACEGCAEEVAALLRASGHDLDIAYVGPREALPLTREVLDSAVLYAQPGGGNSVKRAFRQMKRFAPTIIDYTQSGGRYLGICMGAYLAGTWAGFGFLPDTDQFITSAGADVRTSRDTVVAVDWRGVRRHMFFQDGTVLTPPASGSGGAVLARYASNGEIAALVAPFGRGKVGLSGPHPEASQEWYRSNGLTNPDGIHYDLGCDLVDSLMGP